MANGENVLHRLRQLLIPGLLNAGESYKLELLNLAVWAKSNPGMGSFYRSQHELVAVFKRQGEPK
ncbi:hypothetical protein FHS67_006232 [Aminobacter aminovorans]|uniref:Uncharacterized protein n=1 Tax=Aminobacter aminovorans TaxID=83263 RepID=A0AAC8YMI0_AMIAI|nr:hypothetical protein AA2016_1211 [Aminobacter aminovorans]MBB3709873.1 hypothetical protein [Aminobacter aminovorans]